ncbi:MAG: hypothetical protein R3B99_25180 [Polyangiales bacterium]
MTRRADHLRDLRRSRRLGASAAMLTWLVAGLASAHGPAPAVLEVLTADASGRPTLMRTSVGLVEARDDGTYGYLCPSLWSGNELARAWAMPDGRVAVVDSGALYLADASREAFVRDDALEEAFAVRDVATDGARFFLLAIERTSEGLDRSAIFAHGETPAFVEGRPTDLAYVADSFLADSLLGGPLAASPTPALCEPSGCLGLAHDPIDRLVIRHADEDALWLVATTFDRAVWRVDRSSRAIEVGPAGEAVLGPLPLGGELVVLVDGVAYARVGDTWEAREGTHGWTSLDAVDGHVFASSLDGVFRLDGALDAAELVFRFTQLDGPRASHEDLCGSDWVHFGGESGWVGTRAARTPQGERGETSSGCAAAGGRHGGGLGRCS